MGGCHIGGHLDEAVGSRQSAVADRIDGELMHGQADMQGRIGVEVWVRAPKTQAAQRIGSVTADLAGHEFAQCGSAPVGRRHQVLGRGKRLQPAAKACQEIRERVRVTAGLGGDALDNGQKVLRAVADFAQQRLQGLLAALVLGRFDHGSDDPDHGIAVAVISVYPYLEPADAIVGGNAEFEVFRIAGCNDAAFGRTDAFRLRRRQDAIAVGRVDGPWRAHVACPYGFHLAILIENRNAGIVQCMKKGAAKLHSALSRMQSDDLVTLSSDFHVSGFGMHRSRHPPGLTLNGSPANGFPKRSAGRVP
ncbi:hypothetical protein MESS4_280066 [Mesorhizobium sp. STM 4661]|nr:hypothetical protein MESS4_280066 [Mesorhizobium sp. STM 4661]